MIKSFRHKGLERFFKTGSTSGIQHKHAAKLTLQLTALHAASTPTQLQFPGWRLHELVGDLKGHWSMTVNGNWRVTFKFEGEDVILVDYRDYH